MVTVYSFLQAILIYYRIKRLRQQRRPRKSQGNLVSARPALCYVVRSNQRFAKCAAVTCLIQFATKTTAWLSKSGDNKLNTSRCEMALDE